MPLTLPNRVRAGLSTTTQMISILWSPAIIVASTVWSEENNQTVAIVAPNSADILQKQQALAASTINLLAVFGSAFIFFSFMLRLQSWQFMTNRDRVLLMAAATVAIGAEIFPLIKFTDPSSIVPAGVCSAFSAGMWNASTRLSERLDNRNREVTQLDEQRKLVTGP